jgi:hypothetical protein
MACGRADLRLSRRKFRGVDSMIAIAMVAVFLVVMAVLNRWEFGRFD